MRILWPLLFVAALFSCTNQQSPSLLNREALLKQTFRINTIRDTVLKTVGGALLKIDKGSLTGGDAVELEVKEASSFEDIIKAGLTTQSNGQALSSGGMIFINAVNKNVSIAKPIRVALPTPQYNVKMKLFTGEEKDGKLNWTNPLPLVDSISPYLQRGKFLFNALCSTCHAYDKIIQGPASANLEDRGPWKDRFELLKFTVNPGEYIPRSCYTKDLAAQYNGQIMPSFPMGYESDTFSRMKTDLNAVYDYLKNEDLKRGVKSQNKQAENLCDDSCRRYDSVRYAVSLNLAALAAGRQQLIDSNEKRINYNRWNQTGDVRLPEARDEQGTIPKDLVEPEDYQAVYYRFDITSFGWYNIDDLLTVPDGEWVKLTVSIDDSLSEDPDLFLAVPRLKTFDRGGKLNDGVNYGFFNSDGTINLPIGEKLVVFALTEANGQILFDYKELTATFNNDVHLSPKLITKAGLTAAVKKLSLTALNIIASKSKNAVEIQTIDDEVKRQQNKLDAFKPSSCHCDCEFARDSTAAK